MATMTPAHSSSVPTLGPLERDVLEAVWCISASGQAADDPASGDRTTGGSTPPAGGSAAQPAAPVHDADITGTVSVREVHERLADRGLAYTTISTVLTNLEKKGVVERVSRGRRLQYRATLGRDEYSAALMSEALSYSRDRRASILHFVTGMDASDVDTLRALVERTGGRHPDSPGAGPSGSASPGPRPADPGP